jgi:hypothetical protein
LYLQRRKEAVAIRPMEAVRTIETVRRLESMGLGRESMRKVEIARQTL